jgi:hypothetical protein
MAATSATTHAPQRKVTLASYTTYDDAQQAVDYLSDNGFPVENADIVGYDVRLVEQITGRWTIPRAILAGAGTGAWVGLFVGLIFGLFATGSDWPGLVLGGLFIGAAWGAVFGLFAQWVVRGRRDFRSVQKLVADRYDLLVTDQWAARARALLG